MNYSEFKKAVKKAKRVYGYVAYNENDGIYFELKKVDVLFNLEKNICDSVKSINAHWDEEKNLYIN